MKSRWLSATFLAVALAVSACGGAEETGQLAQEREGDVHALLLECDEAGQCPTGYYCDPGWICRRGVGLTSQSSRETPDSSSLADVAVKPAAQAIPADPSWATVDCCDGTECRSPISAGACISYCESHGGTC